MRAKVRNQWTMRTDIDIKKFLCERYNLTPKESGSTNTKFVTLT